MKVNMSFADKVIRALIAIIIGILYFTNVISGTVGIILLIVGVVFLITSFVGFCPLYTLFGLSTKKNE